MGISLGILSWKAPRTLIQTLDSYRESALDIMVNEKFIFFQELSDMDRRIAEEYGYEYIGADINLGIAGGFRELVNYTKTDIFLFCENDWVNNNDGVKTLTEIIDSKFMLNEVDVVRLRDKKHPGYPLWSEQFKGSEQQHPTHLLDSVYWEEHPKKFPQIGVKGDFYITTAPYANWTNNPFLAKTRWLKEVINPRLKGDIEKTMQPWWEQQNFKVAQGNGLFTHYRID